MTKRRLFVAVIVVLLSILALELKAWIKVDACLDDGGRWNGKNKVCEFTE